MTDTDTRSEKKRGHHEQDLLIAGIVLAFMVQVVYDINRELFRSASPDSPTYIVNIAAGVSPMALLIGSYYSYRKMGLGGLFSFFFVGAANIALFIVGLYFKWW